MLFPDSPYVYCTVSIAPMRREPAHRSEQTSQLLFGERATILEESGDYWMRVRSVWDGYEGWCTRAHLAALEPKAFSKKTRIVCNKHWGKLTFENGEIELPAGSELTGIKGSKITIGDAVGKFKGKKEKLSSITPSAARIIESSMHYINAPYQWGGRTLAGIDCSGLSQIAYKLNGISIPRDASQQAGIGHTVDFLVEAQPGDLIFFDNIEGKINHVGVLINSCNIIHATETSGRVVIDKIDGGGIISQFLRKRTHTLRLIKRIL